MEASKQLEDIFKEYHTNRKQLPTILYLEKLNIRNKGKIKNTTRTRLCGWCRVVRF